MSNIILIKKRRGRDELTYPVKDSFKRELQTGTFPGRQFDMADAETVSEARTSTEAAMLLSGMTNVYGTQVVDEKRSVQRRARKYQIGYDFGF